MQLCFERFPRLRDPVSWSRMHTWPRGRAHATFDDDLLHGRHPFRRDAHADGAAADPGPDVAGLERGLQRPIELRGRVNRGHPG